MKHSRKRVSFEVSADPGSEVYLAGDFNDWDAKKKKMKEKGDGLFESKVLLHEGKHEYKFVINGEWRADTECADWSPNGVGTINSIVNVA